MCKVKCVWIYINLVLGEKKITKPICIAYGTVYMNYVKLFILLMLFIMGFREAEQESYSQVKIQSREKGSRSSQEVEEREEKAS